MNKGCRIARIRLKESGFVVHIKPTTFERDSSLVLGHVSDVMNDIQHWNDVAGFAFVIWNSENTTCSRVRAKPSVSVPVMLIPDYVRNLLLADRIEAWAVDSMNASENSH